MTMATENAKERCRMDASLRTILLATDDSREAAVAARAAGEISNKSGAQMHVVHVWENVPFPPYPGLLFDDHSRTSEREAGELLRRQAREARAAGGIVAGEHLREGRPAKEIVAVAQGLGADLVVVGSRMAGWAKRLIAGSVSEGVARRAPCPVLVVRGGEGAWPPARVVVGDDGSGPAKRAGALAAQIASLFGAEVTLVRAYENPPAPIGGWSARDRLELDEALHRDREALEERAQELAALARGRPETKLIETSATPAVLSATCARDGERALLAVGSRGLEAYQRGLFGSVSTGALRAAEGPVLIAPPEGAAR
jgi:nucleotide-binding universal stress UspA family protein